jgi:hypothetical protein
MKLLERSIEADGFTQPIVSWDTTKEQGKYTVIDGFHRHRVGKESKVIEKKVMGYLPIVIINDDRTSQGDRIASTIRHNRARGKHQVDAMSDIVIELKNRNWKNSRIAKELGMDEDEILRLLQITGLSEMFKDEEFSRSWDIDDSEPDYIPLTDEIDLQEKEVNKFRTVNTGDEKRVFHTYDKWECAKAGFYNPSKEGIKKEDGEKLYADFLSNDKKFRLGLEGVLKFWKNSCEHYLTNESMNRIAWLGQASACYSEKLPQVYCGGFNLLTKKQQEKANNTALEYLNKFLEDRKVEKIDLFSALTTRQSTIY